MAEPVDVNEKTFNRTVLEAKTPFLVDFWAPWCGPCRAMAPVVNELARAYEGRVGFAKVNVDDNPGVANRYSVRSIPTLLLFKDGMPMTQIVGLKPKAELERQLDAALAGRS